jgi:hypothetical protein
VATLLDRVNAWTHVCLERLDRKQSGGLDLERRIYALRARLRGSERFVLDDHFTTTATAISLSDTHDQRMRRAGHAFLPFDTVWIEFKIGTFAKELHRFRPPEAEFTPFNDFSTAGFLLWCTPENYHEWTALFFLDLPQTEQNSIDFVVWPFQFLPKLLINKEHPSASIHGSPEQLLFGAGGNPISKVDDTVSSHPDYKEDNFYRWMGDARGSHATMTGLLRTVLSMINVVALDIKKAPPDLGKVRLQKKGSLRPKPLDRVQILTITAGQTRTVVEQLDTQSPGGGPGKAEHRVRGHVRILHRHTFDEEEVYVRPHYRGDPSLGTITTHYRVRAARE